LAALHDLYDRYQDRVAFLVVYIREAHPEDGWVLSMNRDQEIALADPISSEERAAVGETCALRLAIRLPIAVDGTDDAVARAYGGWPDRLYLIGRNGRIAFQGDEGPQGFLPELLEQAIDAELTTNA